MKYIAYFSSLLLVASVLIPTSFYLSPVLLVKADTVSGQSGGGTVSGTSGAREYSVQNPLKADSISEFVEQVLQAVLIIGIPVIVLFIVLAGLKFVTAMGSPDKLAKAKENLLYVVIGAGLFLGAWTIARVIYSTVKSLGGGI